MDPVLEIRVHENIRVTDEILTCSISYTLAPVEPCIYVLPMVAPFTGVSIFTTGPPNLDSGDYLTEEAEHRYTQPLFILGA